MHTSGFTTLKAHGFCKNRVGMRLRSLGLSDRDAEMLARKIRLWQSSCGVDWTISHLKKMRQVVLNAFAGVSDSVPWIATKRGYPAHYQVLRKYRRTTIMRVLVIYKIFEYTRPQSQQIEKFVKAVTREPVDLDCLKKAEELVINGLIDLAPYEGLAWKVGGNLIDYPVKRSYAKWGVPGLVSFKHVSGRANKQEPNYKARAEMFLDSKLVFERSRFSRDLFPFRRVTFAPFSGIEHRPLNLEAMMLMGTQDEAPANAMMHTGGIAATQEPGGKLRVFASPFPVLQNALLPLEATLDAIQRAIPTDHRNDQEKGAKRVQQWLLDHPAGRVYSIDLSNATDAFPLRLQTAWMRHAGIRQGLVNLFEKVAQGEYWVDEKLVKQGFPDKLTWTVGQPLGSRCSFQSFSLTHNFLVRGIERLLYGGVRNEFAIVGDDVVIFNANVASMYVDVMNSLGCKVALDKTISSAFMAEFCGYLIGRTYMTRTGKQRETTSKRVATNAQNYGKGMRAEVEMAVKATSKHSSVVKVAGDYGLVDVLSKLPKAIGGFNWETGSTLALTLHRDVNARHMFNLMTCDMEMPSLDNRFSKVTVYGTIGALLGYSYRDMQIIAKEYPDAKFVLPPAVLDVIAYDASLYCEHHWRRECISLGPKGIDMLAIGLKALSAIRQSIQHRYWQYPGSELEKDELALLSLLYVKAIDTVDSYKSSHGICPDVDFSELISQRSNVVEESNTSMDSDVLFDTKTVKAPVFGPSPVESVPKHAPPVPSFSRREPQALLAKEANDAVYEYKRVHGCSLKEAFEALGIPHGLD